MLHGRKLGWMLLLVALIAAVMAWPAPTALAQGRTVCGKTVFGGSCVLPSGQTINGNLTMFGGTARLESDSALNGNVSMMGGSLEIAGHVRGDVSMLGGSLHLTSTAVVEGNVSRLGGSVTRDPGAIVNGSVQGLQRGPSVAPAQPFRSGIAPQQSGRGPFGWFLDLMLHLVAATGLGILLALIGALVLLFAPRYTGQVATTVAAQPALNFATGMLTLVLAFLVSLPLMIACGLGLLVWLAALLVLIFGWIAVGLWVGQRLLAALRMQGVSSVVEVIVGVFLITWLTWIMPVCFRWLFGLVVGSIGVGAVLLTRFGTQPASGLGGLNWSSGPSGGGAGLRQAAPPVEKTGRVAEYTVPPAARDAPPAPGRPSAAAAEEVRPAGSEPLVGETGAQSPLPPTRESGLAAASGSSRWTAEASGPEVARTRSLEDLEAVNGITPEIADRLRAAGSTTLVAVATSDPATLAYQAEVSPERVRDEDWIGQARRLLG